MRDSVFICKFHALVKAVNKAQVSHLFSLLCCAGSCMMVQMLHIWRLQKLGRLVYRQAVMEQWHDFLLPAVCRTQELSVFVICNQISHLLELTNICVCAHCSINESSVTPRLQEVIVVMYLCMLLNLSTVSLDNDNFWR